jgi:hypothetical protein
LGFHVYSGEGASVVRTYHEYPDASIVVWDLETCQENDIHTHEQNLHVF